MRASIFKEFAQSVSPEILKTYLDTILDSVVITDGYVESIIFGNGLSHNLPSVNKGTHALFTEGSRSNIKKMRKSAKPRALNRGLALFSL